MGESPQPYNRQSRGLSGSDFDVGIGVVLLPHKENPHEYILMAHLAIDVGISNTRTTAHE